MKKALLALACTPLGGEIVGWILTHMSSLLPVDRLRETDSLLAFWHPDQRFSRCPFCGEKTGQRKRPLLIHVEPMQMMALGYTCRYCSDCDLLIADKHEIEHLLTDLFLQRDPEMIGNDYLIMGTVRREAWRESLHKPKLPKEMLDDFHRFKIHHQELRMTRPGWYKEDQEPPMAEPPPSQEWIKAK